MTALELLKEELLNAREAFDSTVSDIQEEHLHKDPGGLALTLAGAWAHLIFSEDVIVQQMIKGAVPLHLGEWKGKTGASEELPAMDEKWAETHAAWSKNVKLDVPQFKLYTDAVYKATDELVNILVDEDLDKQIDLGPWGKKSIAHMLYAFMIAHTNQLTGEISAIKGVHGAKGYPF